MTSLARSDQKRLMTKAARLTLVLVATILLGAILFSVSSAHKNTNGRLESAAAASAGVGRQVSTGSYEGGLNKLLIGGGTNKTALSAFLAPPPGDPEVMETFAVDGLGNCTTTPKSAFILTEKVCAKLSGGPPLSLYPRKFAWISNSNVIFQTTDVVTDPQTDIFMLPAVDPGTDYRGVWRVIDMSASDGSVRTEAYFSVSNPALPAANLAIYKSNDTDGTITAGSNVLFALFVTNYGPDTATNVTITDDTPANTSFVTGSGFASPGVSCTFPSGATGPTNCTIASLPQGASGKITLVVNVSSGTSPGTTISNTATISGGAASGSTPATCSTGCDPYTLDNTATSDVNVIAGVPGPTCTLECPASITTFANTTEGGQRGAHVTFTDPTSAGDCGSVTSTPASGSFFPVGTTAVTATSETGGGMCSFNITVEEATGNVSISCPANPPAANANGDCEATVAVGTPTATGDNVTVFATRSDGKPMYDCDANGNCTRRASDAPFSAGTTTITWTAYSHDTAGPWTTPATCAAGDTPEECHRTGSASCVEAITVNDVTPPVITATDATVPADANCQAAVPDYSNAVTDNCSCSADDNSQDCVNRHRITTTQDPAAGTMVGLGNHPIHITANDGSSNNNGAGNTTEKTIILTVADTTAPTITCPSNISIPNTPGTCNASVSPGVPTATDNCDGSVTPIPSRSDNKPITDPFPVGTVTIHWTATDSAGNSSSCDQTVVVLDNENPTITCPSNITTNTDPGTCSATVNPGTATATDNCGSGNPPTVTGTRSDGQPLNAPYPKGTTTIHWTATDSAGNSSSCDQTVTVNDNENPVITCPANITRSTDPGACSASINPGTATATDNCGSASVSGARSDAQPLSAPYPKGTTTIHWTATDGSGNTASCDQTITVNDTEAPAISCPANITTGTEPGTCSAHVATGTATATDNCGSTTVTGTRSDGRPLTDTYPKGTTTITWTATDSSGNQSSCTQTITVVDNQPPTMTFNGQTPTMWPPNHSYHTFTPADFISSVSDNCDSLTVNDVYITKATSDEAENASGSGNTLNDIVIGTNCKSIQLRSERVGGGNGRVYTIYFKLKDSSGNFTTGTAKVTVSNGGSPVDDGPHYTVTGTCP